MLIELNNRTGGFRTNPYSETAKVNMDKDTMSLDFVREVHLAPHGIVSLCHDFNCKFYGSPGIQVFGNPLSSPVKVWQIKKREIQQLDVQQTAGKTRNKIGNSNKNKLLRIQA